ncbi:MAG: cation:dicarboxylase symporter family transporter [Oscillospiraceae bacterium]|nr:cation:dicarboxylase symporter family transporter [Oscillospiraceae bacterium]
METTAKETAYDLSGSSIQALCEEITAFLTAHGTAKKEILKVTLTLEEALLNYRDHLPESSAVTLRMFALLGTFRVTVAVEGERCDPFDEKEYSVQSIMGTLVAAEDAARSTWKYKAPRNEIAFTAQRERKLSSLARIALGILCGMLLGNALLLLPGETAGNIASGYIKPVTDAYTGLLCVMAAPMCFFAIVLGIVRMGNLSAVGSVAKRMAVRIVFTALIVSFFGALAASSQLYFGAGAGRFSSLSALWEIVTGFVPTNILSPMLEFNSVQIIIVGIMFGASMLAMGQKAESAIELFDTLNSVSVTCNVCYLNRFIPFYVALTMMGIICAGRLSVAPGLLRLLLDILIGEMIILMYFVASVCIRLRIPLRELLHKMAPSFMIAQSSASFGAAFVENLNSLLELGVDKDYAAFGFNIGGIIFRPGECVIFMASSLYTAFLFGMEVSWGWIVTAFLLSFLLSVATPSVPGGTAISLVILSSQLGFPDEVLTLLIPVSVILEFPTVAIDTFCAKSQILLLASAVGKVDLSRTRKA